MKANRLVSLSTKSALVHFSAFFMLTVSLLISPQFKNLDRKINDIILQSTDAINSSDIVIVDLDQKTTVSAKSFPISRSYIADAVSEIANQNPKRVLLDILFVADGKESDDQKLKDAFNKFDKGTLAIAGLAPAYTQGKAVPNPKFTNNATVFNSVMAHDKDGFYRRIGIKHDNYQKDLNNPARWLAGQEGSDALILDQSAHPNSFKRYSLSDFVDGNAPDVSGKLVIIGQVSRLLGVPVLYPLFGSIDRTQFFALGASTLLDGQEQYELSLTQLLCAIAFIALIAYLVAFKLLKNVKLLRTSLVALTVIFSVNFFLHYYFNISLNIVLSSLVWKIAFLITLAYKYRLLDVIKEIMSGDLSPEEAWQWRAMKEHHNPCVLMGLKDIKRINQAALNSTIFDDDGSNFLNFNQTIASLKNQSGANIELSQNGTEKNFELTQPFDNIALYQLRDTTDEQIEKDRLSQLIFTDQLTNCLNKAGYEKALEKIAANNSSYAIFILDLNGFKAANDTYGHVAGDTVLNVCAARLQTVLRSTDTLARIGGDEFAVIAQGQFNEENLLSMRDKLEDSIGTFVKVEKNNIKIGISAGYAQALPGKSSKTVMEKADASMYERKTYLKSIGQAALRNAAA